MIKTVKNIGTKSCPINFYVSEFDSITDLSKYIATAPTNKVFEYEERTGDLASKEIGNRDGFYDFVSFSDALEAFEYGTDRYYKEFVDKYKVTKSYIENQLLKKPNGFKKDVVGFMPIVPNVLIGTPVNMLTSDVKPKKIPTAKVIIDRSACARNSGNRLIKFSSIIFALIQILENRGVRCEIYVSDTGGQNNEGRGLLLKLKEFMQPLNLFKIQFPIISPDFLRRIGFRLTETDTDLKESDWTCGYGKPLKYCRWKGFDLDNGVLGDGYKNIFDLADTDIYVPGIDTFNFNDKLEQDTKEIINNTNFKHYFNLGE